ncbi:unnamed protein product [Hymenolepis diminuta]|uniref:Uncharacterized protein n=1 Tax=Hymenolepis diminuta TaxID=6216 RepID=A0A564YZZ1_HYMDI|nr:unnamed protein product [Hymenolepis diminuta]
MVPRVLTQMTHINCLYISTPINRRVSYWHLHFPLISSVPQLSLSFSLARFNPHCGLINIFRPKMAPGPLL